jgi:hypothetical protein
MPEIVVSKQAAHHCTHEVSRDEKGGKNLCLSIVAIIRDQMLQELIHVEVLPKGKVSSSENEWRWLLENTARQSVCRIF